jgi:fructokinase
MLLSFLLMTKNSRALNTNRNHQPVIFGEVLFDCFPDGRQVLGGAPFNVAWNLQAFGLQPLLFSRVGDDHLGQLILQKMRSWNMSTTYLQVDTQHPTGKVQIELTEGEPKFSILSDQAYDHIDLLPENTLKNKPSFLYHGSLAIRNNNNDSTLSSLKERFLCPVFVDVNLRTPWWDIKRVKILVEDATWLKLNKDELEALFPGQQNMELRCRQILELFDLETVFVTMGDKGALALNRNNGFIRTEPRESIKVVDTVGAGDAFSSVLLLGFMKNWPLEITMHRAQEFASAVVGLRGAIIDDRNFYQVFINTWDLT